MAAPEPQPAVYGLGLARMDVLCSGGASFCNLFSYILIILACVFNKK